MAAPKAREIVRLHRDDDGNVTIVTTRDGSGYEQEQAVRFLPRVELMRVVAQVWPGKRDWRRYGNDAIVKAITLGELPDVIDVASVASEPVAPNMPVKAIPSGWEPLATTTAQGSSALTASVPTPINDPAPINDSDEGDPLAKALRVAMRSIASDASDTVNEQQVRNIVKGEVEGLIATAVSDIARPQITMIQVNQQEPVQVAGRTHKQFQEVVSAMGARVHLYLTGSPGTGKTFVVEQAAEALGLSFYSIQCHAQMPASQVWGYFNATGECVGTLFRQAFEDGGVFLFDEIDNGNSNVLASMNAALANGVCAFPDGMVKKHPDFIVVAAGNTYGTGPDAMFVGRNALDAATLDRFVRRSFLIDEDLENDVAMSISSDHAVSWLTTIRRYRERVEAHNLRVIVSPRATFNGLRLLNAGWAKQDVVEATVLAGLTQDQRTKLAGS